MVAVESAGGVLISGRDYATASERASIGEDRTRLSTPRSPGKLAPTIPKVITIDFEELKFGFENNDLEVYLDTKTGEVITWHEDFEDADELRERIDEGFGDRIRRIDPLESRMGFQIMEDFALSVPELRLKARLFEALSQNKPFRRFKDVLHSHLELRDRWFAFHDKALADYATAWLKREGIKAELKLRQA